MSEPLAIAARDVWKTFSIPRNQVHTLKERALHPLRRNEFDRLRALRGVTFGVRKGEFFGIVGRNGSGKSTMLKCLAGIYGVDRGQIYVDGRMSTFIELGVGFNPDLAARDNIIVNATMLGLSPREARDRTDRIIDFAELHEFVDLKIKNYSSGMLVRLAFSVMIQVDAEILLIDEVLAVGDAAFQQKCYEEFARIRRSNATVILVTHDMNAVDRFCDRAMLLEHGRLVEQGVPRDIGARYLELNFSREARAREALQEATEDTLEGERPSATGSVADASDTPVELEVITEDRKGDGRGEIVEAWFEADGRRAEVLPGGADAALVMRVRFSEEVENPVFGMSLRNTTDDAVFAASTRHEEPTGRFLPGEDVEVRFGFTAYLAPDRYLVTASIAREGFGLAWIDHREGFMQIPVTTPRPTGGLLDLPARISLTRDPAGQATGAAR